MQNARGDAVRFELEHHFLLNPDGSGRVHLRWWFANDVAASADAVARTELEQAHGVDAWGDLRCEPDGDGVRFEAVAWFRDSRALRFHCQGLHLSLLDLSVEPQADGSVVIAAHAHAPAATAATDDFTQLPTPALLAAERQKLATALPFLESLLSGVQCRATVQAPGPIVSLQNAEQVAEAAAHFACNGDQVVASLQRLMQDDGLLTELLLAGAGDPFAALHRLEQQGPMRLRTSAAVAPLFDYEQEVQQARELFTPVAEAAGAAMPAGPAQPLTDVRVIASKVVFEADQERDLTPQSEGRPGVWLSIAGELPASVLEITECEYERLTARDGTDLAAPDAWDRRSHFPRRTNDGRTVCFDVVLPMPADGSGFAELSGRLTCVCSDGHDEVPLGLPHLRQDASSEVLGARILGWRSEDDGSTSFDLSVQLPQARVLGCALVDGKGRRELRRVGYNSGSDQCELTFHIEGKVKPKSDLVLTIANNLSQVRLDYTLRAFDLLGRPLPH